MPSYVCFKKKDNKILVGEPAKKALNVELENTVYDAKRLIGRYFDEPSVTKDRKNWNFTIVEGANKKP